jgi:single-strand DNA-binding protein
MTMNKVLIIGNAGKDPEMRYTPNGAPVTTFTMATNRRYTTSDGEQREETEWFTVAAWNQLAEQVNQFITKGRKVYVEGRLKTSPWIGNDGEPRSGLEVTADRVLFLDRPGGAPGAQETGDAAEPVGDAEDIPW